ncbi:MAG TPA: PGPGW domain-containing protein [Lacipirellulaceae bacterium]|nr:PGPGW domain-containing protein [Lacipirellulaceae bacterium]
MEWLKSLWDWLWRLAAQHATIFKWSISISVAMAVISPFAIVWLIIRMPADYFAEKKHPPLESLEQHFLVRAAILTAKNLLGAILFIAGVIMLVTPGQGVLTIFVSLSLLDFPGKFRFERWLITRPRIWHAINAIRRRAGHAELEPPAGYKIT